MIVRDTASERRALKPRGLVDFRADDRPSRSDQLAVGQREVDVSRFNQRVETLVALQLVGSESTCKRVIVQASDENIGSRSAAQSVVSFVAAQFNTARELGCIHQVVAPATGELYQLDALKRIQPSRRIGALGDRNSDRASYQTDPLNRKVGNIAPRLEPEESYFPGILWRCLLHANFIRFQVR